MVVGCYVVESVAIMDHGAYVLSLPLRQFEESVFVLLWDSFKIFLVNHQKALLQINK